MSRVFSRKVDTKPYQDQKPGTSGVRKHVSVFQQEHYTENFIQSVLSALGDRADGCTLVIGGDGRYLVKDTVQTIVQMAGANGVSNRQQTLLLPFSDRLTP